MCREEGEDKGYVRWRGGGKVVARDRGMLVVLLVAT